MVRSTVARPPSALSPLASGTYATGEASGIPASLSSIDATRPKTDAEAELGRSVGGQNSAALERPGGRPMKCDNYLETDQRVRQFVAIRGGATVDLQFDRAQLSVDPNGLDDRVEILTTPVTSFDHDAVDDGLVTRL